MEYMDNLLSDDNTTGSGDMFYELDTVSLPSLPSTPPSSVHGAQQAQGQLIQQAIQDDNEEEEEEEGDHEDTKALISLGLDRSESVCIPGPEACKYILEQFKEDLPALNTVVVQYSGSATNPEWVISDVEAIFAGVFATVIYLTNGPEACKYILEHSNYSIILIVEDEKQLDKLWQFKEDLPALKKVVQYSGSATNPEVLGWNYLMRLGRGLGDDLLQDRLKRIDVNQCCTLVYTSGTIGNPKGIMLSHNNITFQAKVPVKKLKFRGGSILIDLPLSHQNWKRSREEVEDNALELKKNWKMTEEEEEEEEEK